MNPWCPFRFNFRSDINKLLECLSSSFNSLTVYTFTLTFTHRFKVHLHWAKPHAKVTPLLGAFSTRDFRLAWGWRSQFLVFNTHSFNVNLSLTTHSLSYNIKELVDRVLHLRWDRAWCERTDRNAFILASPVKLCTSDAVSKEFSYNKQIYLHQNLRMKGGTSSFDLCGL